ncbi:hypothetical protein [Sphingomonas sp. NIC1]|uniref:hypothetical protein n=1 Tax=Sphingomonas sp. NIC1 TaxID=1961362 RepID=UPI00125D6D06|nr:hypothetical protein [Sphingomonas sp. NIC1]
MTRKNKLRVGQPLGNRSASGRKRDRAPIRVEPCEGVLRRRQAYQLVANDTDTCDALGRAYSAGLLGTGEHAKSLMIAGRKIAGQYWRVLGFPTPDSLARFQPRAPSTPMDPEREKIMEAALNDGLAMVRALSRDHRRAFDMLVIDPNPDCGPAWLDRIVYAHRRGEAPREADLAFLRLAKEGLEVLA